jgi:tRNA threonylcarbamoyladenosine biosynthesis protein TsaE
LCPKVLPSSSTDEDGRSRRFGTTSSEATFRLGAKLAALLQDDDVVFLSGPLGAGKTVFAKGIASGLSISPAEEVLSPSYTLLRTYEGRFVMHHLDLYRIRKAQEAWDLAGMASTGILVVEWPERGAGYLPDPIWRVEMVFEVSDRRVITISGPSLISRIQWP